MHATDHICSTNLGSMSLVVQNFQGKEAAVGKVEVGTTFLGRKRYHSIRLPVLHPIIVIDNKASEHNRVSCLGKHTAVILVS